MKVFGLYKHRNNTDVAMLILKSLYINGKYKLKVGWVNVVGKPQEMGVIENLVVTKAKMLEFELIDAY